MVAVTAVAELLVGFWAAGSWNVSVVVLVAMVGVTAILRGITVIVDASQLRDLTQMSTTARLVA